MARIIESSVNSRRMVKLSTNDIISIVQEYQQIAKGAKCIDNIRTLLEDRVIFLPEDWNYLKTDFTSFIGMANPIPIFEVLLSGL